VQTVTSKVTDCCAQLFDAVCGTQTIDSIVQRKVQSHRFLKERTEPANDFSVDHELRMAHHTGENMHRAAHGNLCVLCWKVVESCICDQQEVVNFVNKNVQGALPNSSFSGPPQTWNRVRTVCGQSIVFSTSTPYFPNVGTAGQWSYVRQQNLYKLITQDRYRTAYFKKLYMSYRDNKQRLCLEQACHEEMRNVILPDGAGSAGYSRWRQLWSMMTGKADCEQIYPLTVWGVGNRFEINESVKCLQSPENIELYAQMKIEGYIPASSNAPTQADVCALTYKVQRTLQKEVQEGRKTATEALRLLPIMVLALQCNTLQQQLFAPRIAPN